MKSWLKAIAWILGNVATVPLVFFASLKYWTAAVAEEYRTGARVSTDGDIVVIPAMQDTMAWIALLVVVNFVVLVVVVVRHRRNRRPNNSFKPKPLRGSA